MEAIMRLANMIQAVDAHACGEHGRVIVGGVLDVPGDTMFDKMTYLRTRADGLRRGVVAEPPRHPAGDGASRAPTRRRTAISSSPLPGPKLTPASSSWSRWNIRACPARTPS